ncbi:amidophosphoribosyltransferase [Poronia punctata]|nr:amidophosphoribosyltransferase [Poronia punctata]
MCGVAASPITTYTDPFPPLSHITESTPPTTICLSTRALTILQRGQDAAGIAVCQGSRIYQCKGNGMAASVFEGGAKVAMLPGFQGIAHLRYPTAGTSSALEAQPFYVNSPFGLAMSVNGNLVNSEELIEFLDLQARRHVNTDSDSELLLNVFAYALNELGKTRADVQDVFTALREVYSRCQGAFADEYGIRPLCIGSRPSDTLEGATDYFMASESVALKQLGFSNIVDILPGQAVFCKKGGTIEFCQIVEPKAYAPDIFEFFYFARPDTFMDGISVHRSRENMGRKLAQKMKRTLSEKEIREIDVIIPVPETSNTAAAVLAQELGKPFSNAFVKCRYIHRTFIIAGQKSRQSAVRRKLSPITSEFHGKVVCIVDDSLVRGTTSREIVHMAKESGATRVLFVSCSPEVTHPHVLIARGKTTQEVANLIHADELVYGDLEDLKEACLAGDNTKVTSFEVGVFSGKYQTAIPKRYFEGIRALEKTEKATPHSRGSAEYR